MPRVAFIGVGTMGLPMARHLVAAGHDVVACDLDPGKAAALGSEVGATAREASSGAEFAILSLPSAAAVEAAVLGPDGVESGIAAGAVVIDMSTSPPALMRRLHAVLAARGVAFVDAPVSGGPTGAEAATLAIMVGGEEEAVARCRPLLQAMGATVEHVGGPGAGQAVKLANNLVVACTMAALGEACLVLEREGLDPAQAYEVFTGSTSDSAVLRRRYPLAGARPEHPSSRDYAPMFRLDLLVKDLGLALELAAADGVAAPVASSALDAYRAAVDRGFGGLDYSAVILAQRSDS